MPDRPTPMGQPTRKHLVAVIDDNNRLAAPSEMTAVRASRLPPKAAGHWVFAADLAATGTATVIDNRASAANLTNCPSLESTEYMAGF